MIVHDEGSKSQTALVEITGVPAYGIVDTGADITIIGPKLFKKVAMFAKLKKRKFKEPDKVPHTYDRRQFKLDGQLHLDVDFDDKMINTPIYVKMDVYDDLLLSEECVDTWELLTIILVSRVRQLKPRIRRYIHQPGVYELA